MAFLHLLSCKLQGQSEGGDQTSVDVRSPMSDSETEPATPSCSPRSVYEPERDRDADRELVSNSEARGEGRERWAPPSSRARPVIAKSLKALRCNFPVCGVLAKPAFSPSFNHFISVLINSCFVASYKRNYRKTRSVIMQNNLVDNSFCEHFAAFPLQRDKSVTKRFA